MRLYNGCPDNELAALWKSRDDARAALKEVEPSARCVWYPMEAFYMVWMDDERGVGQPVGGFDATYRTVEHACRKSIEILRNLPK